MKRILLILYIFLIHAQFILGSDASSVNAKQPWTRWWWLGSAVDSAGIKYELNALHNAGFGGVEITPLYGVKGEENRFLDYLSPAWVDMLTFTLGTAQDLGMGVDMNLGTGWPFGGPQITPDHAAQHLVIRKTTADSLLINLPEHLLAIMVSSQDRPKIYTEGLETVIKEYATQEITAIYYTGTGQMVKRAAPGAEGLVMDHLSHSAFQQYLARFDSSITLSNWNALRCQFNDSYEVYGADWTPDLFNSFYYSRGYDLRDHLDALAGIGDPEVIARIKSDYRETLSDMLLNNFTASWTKWAHDRNCLTRNQAHGSPANLLDLYATVDIPETEIYGPSGFPIPGLRTDPDFPSHQSTPPDPLMMKFASSAANVGGKTLASSESFTWLGEHFRTALSQCKPEIDQLFCAGINHLFFHGTCYSPQDADWPGWLFYASEQFGPVNTIWHDLPQMNKYITNCQDILQQSEPDNDILLYWPVYDVWHNSEGLMQQFMVHNLNEWLYPTDFYHIAGQLQKSGYTFDYISDRQIAQLEISGQDLTINRRKYRALIIPKTLHMPLATLQKLYNLANKGITVIFNEQYPSDVPGFLKYKERQKELEHLVKTGNQISGKTFHKSSNIMADLENLGIYRETLADSGLIFIRKTMNRLPVYFVSNLTAKPVDGWVPFALASKTVWLCKTLHDCPGKGHLMPINDHETRVYLQLEPGESTFLLFDFELNQEYNLYKPAGEAVSLNGPWNLEFTEGGPELPSPVTLKTLKSWTNINKKELSRFAGTGKYTLHFVKPEATASFWRLDLGKVYESARIRLNGKDVDILWALPFTTVIPATDLLDDNVLEIEVTNLAANRIIDMDKRKVYWKRFYDINFVDLNYHPFDASHWDLLPSGLVGPVKLEPLRLFFPDTTGNESERTEHGTNP